MPLPPDPYVTHCLELLSPLGAARARRMFGGYGVYVDDLFIALVISERLYLKVDDASRARFEAAGCEAFVYDTREGRRAVMSYYTAPHEALESPALMQPWGRLALQAALSAANRKVPHKPRRTVATASRRAKPRA